MPQTLKISKAYKIDDETHLVVGVNPNDASHGGLHLFKGSLDDLEEIPIQGALGRRDGTFFITSDAGRLVIPSPYREGMKASWSGQEIEELMLKLSRQS